MIGGKQLEWLPLGDSAVTVRFGSSIELHTHRRVMAVSDHWSRHRFPGMIEVVPAFASVTVHYEPAAVWTWSRHEPGQGGGSTIFEAVCGRLGKLLQQLSAEEEAPSRTVEVPVYYGGEAGPDLEFVARHNGLGMEEVIELHSSAVYTVYMIGFAPGFPYLGGMTERIAAPRRASPRPSVPAGSVGIAGAQTGIYPFETPGGWQLIGRTPLRLFLPDQDPPSYLLAGDRLRFRPVSLEAYHELRLSGEGML
ncbi:5-oxoprolinase subunit PxpB [Paenibacillus puerhi]|uniref:5-oxoprolinase subunit PxpB n=1 Tax=Paenibacillus puerhi TaxID=2692622 RepID=UPI00135AE562|nr:5-oxoprolinase subunit PxpB [Paenibacillus puerhi]